MPWPAYKADDVQLMLDEFGVPVTIGGVTAKCIVKDSDEEIASSSNSALVGRAIVLKAARDTFPAAAQGAAATVDYPAVGTAYTIVSVRREPQLLVIVCAKV